MTPTASKSPNSWEPPRDLNQRHCINQRESSRLPRIAGYGGFVRVFGALILVVGIFLGGVWLFKNWQRFTVQKVCIPSQRPEVRSLGQRQSLYVVGYQQQRMLLAASPAGITLVSHLPVSEETEATAPAPKMSFAEAFQQVVTRKQ